MGGSVRANDKGDSDSPLHATSTKLVVTLHNTVFFLADGMQIYVFFFLKEVAKLCPLMRREAHAGSDGKLSLIRWYHSGNWSHILLDRDRKLWV